MTWCRSDRMFFFSDAAQSNSQFPEYKAKLENAVSWYDRYTDVLTYTPRVADATYILVTALQASLDSQHSYSTLFSILHIGIPIVATGIREFSIAAKKNMFNVSTNLISEGVSLGFFKIIPDLPSEPSDNTPLIEDPQQQVHTDAMSHRLLAR